MDGGRRAPCPLFGVTRARRPAPTMSYPQGYLYQAPGSLALYSCPAYGASALAAPRSEELARSASGSAFSPYPGSAAFTAQAATGFGSPLQYSADAAAAAAGFPSYMVTARGRAGGRAGRGTPGVETLIAALAERGRGSASWAAGNVPWEVAPQSPTGVAALLAGREARTRGRAVGRRRPERGPRLALHALPLGCRGHFPQEPVKCDSAGVGMGSVLGGPSFRRRSSASSPERAGARFFRREARGSAPLGPPGRLPSV